MIELGADMPVQPRRSLSSGIETVADPSPRLVFVQATKAICKQVTAELDGKVQPLVRRSRSA